MKIHRDRRSDAARRQRTARRFAVGRRMNGCELPPAVRSHAGGMAARSWLPASSASDGYPDPPFGQNGAPNAPSGGRRSPILLVSRPLRPITATSDTGSGS